MSVVADLFAKKELYQLKSKAIKGGMATVSELVTDSDVVEVAEQCPWFFMAKGGESVQDMMRKAGEWDDDEGFVGGDQDESDDETTEEEED